MRRRLRENSKRTQAVNPYWSIPRMWEGGECWIIGGGASIPRQFGVPTEIIQMVERKEAPFSIYSDYLKQLHSKHVIGTNLTFQLGDWVSVMYFCDSQLFRGYKSRILDFHNLKATCGQSFGTDDRKQMKNIKRLRRDNRPGLSKRPDMICWNSNSGAGAINFAVLAGAKRILLLGFDMRADGEGKTHWVNGSGGPLYKYPTHKSAFKNFMKRFPYIAEDAKKMGVEILNVNPDSALDVFPKVSLNQVL